MQQKFNLRSGNVVIIDVVEKGNCIIVSQRLKTNNKIANVKRCTVTCPDTGKSHSWTCPRDKTCAGDCSDPDNPTGSCA